MIDAPPSGVHPVILADRGYARANIFAFLKIHGLDQAIRVDKGTCMTEADGRRWIERSLKDSGSRFDLASVQVSTPDRLTRLLVALTIALA